MEHINNLLVSGSPIVIVSGEGEQGSVEEYTGTRTITAIKRRLAKEQASGDRWARAEIYSHSNEHGHTGVDIESGEYINYSGDVKKG